MAVEVLVSLLQCVLMHHRQSDGEAASDALEVLLRILLDGTRQATILYNDYPSKYQTIYTQHDSCFPP